MGCNRVGKPPSDEDKGRAFSKGSLQADCTFKLNMKPMCTEPYVGTKGGWLYKDIWTGPIKFADNIQTIHGGKCEPGLQNRVATQQRSGMCKYACVFLKFVHQ